MNRHRFDPFSFAVGVVAVTVAVLVLAWPTSFGLADLRVAGPVVLLALGVALLASGGRRTDRPVDEVPTAGADVPVGVAATSATRDDATEGGAPDPGTPDAGTSHPGASDPGSSDTTGQG